MLDEQINEQVSKEYWYGALKAFVFCLSVIKPRIIHLLLHCREKWQSDLSAQIDFLAQQLPSLFFEKIICSAHGGFFVLFDLLLLFK